MTLTKKRRECAIRYFDTLIISLMQPIKLAEYLTLVQTRRDVVNAVGEKMKGILKSADCGKLPKSGWKRWRRRVGWQATCGNQNRV
jgi:hypothetical protein